MNAMAETYRWTRGSGDAVKESNSLCFHLSHIASALRSLTVLKKNKGELEMSRVILIGIVLFTLLLSVVTLAVGKAEQFLVGYWPFDEGTGKKAKDVSGNGNDGELINGPKWVQGKFGTALEFAGDGSYVNVPDDASLDLTDAATVMAWFKLTADLTATSRMMSKNNSIFVIFDFGGPNSLDFLVKPANDFVESTTTDWVIGEWYHFAGTFDKGTMKIYINGEPEGEKKNAAGIDASDLELWIGADDWQPPASSFPGVIDEVRIYSKAFTEGEIKEAMEAPQAVPMTPDKLPVTWNLLKVAR